MTHAAPDTMLIVQETAAHVLFRMEQLLTMHVSVSDRDEFLAGLMTAICRTKSSVWTIATIGPIFRAVSVRF